VGYAISDERTMKRLAIPERFWNFIAASWKRHDSSLYGRLDLCYDGKDPAKLLEYNADTPTSLFEAAVFRGTGSTMRTADRSARCRPVQLAS
jgi:glutathionylspermidine synthase